jgi:hypothetical protein
MLCEKQIVLLIFNNKTFVDANTKRRMNFSTSFACFQDHVVEEVERRDGVGVSVVVTGSVAGDSVVVVSAAGDAGGVVVAAGVGDSVGGSEGVDVGVGVGVGVGVDIGVDVGVGGDLRRDAGDAVRVQQSRSGALQLCRGGDTLFWRSIVECEVEHTAGLQHAEAEVGFAQLRGQVHHCQSVREVGLLIAGAGLVVAGDEVLDLLHTLLQLSVGIVILEQRPLHLADDACEGAVERRSEDVVVLLGLEKQINEPVKG